MFRELACVLSASTLLAPAAFADTAPTAAPVAAKDATAQAQPKLRCKRYTEIGSLAKVRKECHTDAEWQQLAAQGRENARNMMTTVSSQAAHQ